VRGLWRNTLRYSALRAGLDPYMVGDGRRRFAVVSINYREVIDAFVSRAIVD